MDADQKKGTPQELALNKFRYWMDRNCVGIVAKMATNAKYASALGFKPGDFRAAILEGATHLRIGTAITGNRLWEG